MKEGSHGAIVQTLPISNKTIFLTEGRRSKAKIYGRNIKQQKFMQCHSNLFSCEELSFSTLIFALVRVRKSDERNAKGYDFEIR